MQSPVWQLCLRRFVFGGVKQGIVPVAGLIVVFIVCPPLCQELSKNTVQLVLFTRKGFDQKHVCACREKVGFDIIRRKSANTRIDTSRTHRPHRLGAQQSLIYGCHLYIHENEGVSVVKIQVECANLFREDSILYSRIDP